MGKKQLKQVIAEFFDGELRKKYRRKKHLREIQKSLKRTAIDLKKKMEKASEKERKGLKVELAVVRAHRKKAVRMLRKKD